MVRLNFQLQTVFAIYFNAPWKYEFEKEDTYRGIFNLFDGPEHRIVSAGGIKISTVIHQTFIDVQEEGTEAAAVTTVGLDGSSGGEYVPTYFKADRPFLYVIKENSTGAIVFIGKVGKPEHS